MELLEKYRERINRELSNKHFNGTPVELYEPVSYMLSLGGKRIRPALTLIGCDIYNGDIELALDPAIGLEIFHNFTLVHDDIMDQAETRRGKATVFKKWNPDIAILSGDLMQIIASTYLLKVHDKVLRDVLETFYRMASSVCEGQQMDMNFENTDDVTPGQYIKMITLKTATLLASSLEIGARVAMAPEEDIVKLHNFGLNLGISFQIQDDLLDTFGDPGVFGKKIGGDILSNKKTFLMINAFEKADAEESRILKTLIHSKEIDPEEKIGKVKDIFKLLGVDKNAAEERDKYYNRALSNIIKLNISDSKKKPLLELAEFIVKRNV